MHSDLVATLAKMRLIVGYLGEKAQLNWWPSAFLSPAAHAFAAPVFPRTHVLARYHGVVEAARRAHDRHIGVGAVYHLFRLSEAIEEKLHELIQKGPEISSFLTTLTNRAAAEAALRNLCGGMAGAVVIGPVRVGSTKDISQLEVWRTAMTHYYSAMSQGAVSYPYFAD